MPRFKWDLRVHVMAEPEILTLKKFFPHILKTLVDQFQLLATLEDPRRHQNVKNMSGNAEGWYRLALYDHNYRVIFRLLYRPTLDDKWMEVWEKDTVEARGQFIIEITRVGHRSKVYEENTLFLRKKDVGRSE